MSSKPFSTGRMCRSCGAPLAFDAPGSACWSCMIEAGAAQTGESGTASSAPSSDPSNATAPANILTEPGLPADPFGDGAIGQMIGAYKLREQLGEGGCGVVYVAEQSEPVRRRVALKLIKPGMDSKQVIARFEAERQALAMMDHPNIARVLDGGATEAGRPYFVMELVRGIKITEYCDQTHLSTRKRIELFIHVCRAVQHAHQKGIIHRDLKPSNILVTLHDGVPVPKVIDFGIAKATEGRLTDATVYTQLNQLIGTPSYMSPEQAEMSGLDIDTRSDIYSLGVLLYELLAGSTPFDARELLASGLDAMRKTIREKEPIRPSTRLRTLEGAEGTTTAKHRSAEVPQLIHQLRGDLDWIVMKCLEKDRARRYETANGLAADLQRHLDNEPVTARPPSTAYRFQKLVRRNKAAAVGVCSVVLALVFGLGLATTALVRERAARQRELTQSIRADSVANFIASFVGDALPSLIQQGNVKTAKELVRKADDLASSSLSNAPAAEITLRLVLGRVLCEMVWDYPAGLRQWEAIVRLMPSVADDQLPFKRETLRMSVFFTRLWAAGGQIPEQEKAMKELDNLYVEFMSRTPPAREAAGELRFSQGVWLNTAGQLDRAEVACEEAYGLIRRDRMWVMGGASVPALYARVLAQRGKLAQAEQVARESLGSPSETAPEARGVHSTVLVELINVLCLQNRFDEATATLDQERRWLAANGGSEEDLARVDALRGEVLARSGHGREALPVLAAVATNRFSSAGYWNMAAARDWRMAATLAAAIDDEDSFQRLCQIGVLRFSSTAEGFVAFDVGSTLLLRATDQTIRAVASALLDRADNTLELGLGPTFTDMDRAVLAWREGRYLEALRLLERFRNVPITGPLFRLFPQLPAHQASVLFLRATICAELERKEEARRLFAQGQKQLTLALGDKPGHDRGSQWHLAYQAEIRHREAIAVFKAKGIPLPEPPVK